MSDQLASWLQVIIGLVALVPAFLPLLRRSNRRTQRTVRVSHWRIGCIERTSVEMTDTRQL